MFALRSSLHSTQPKPFETAEDRGGTTRSGSTYSNQAWIKTYQRTCHQTTTTTTNTCTYIQVHVLYINGLVNKSSHYLHKQQQKLYAAHNEYK